MHNTSAVSPRATNLFKECAEFSVAKAENLRVKCQRARSRIYNTYIGRFGTWVSCCTGGCPQSAQSFLTADNLICHTARAAAAVVVSRFGAREQTFRRRSTAYNRILSSPLREKLNSRKNVARISRNCFPCKWYYEL